nr:hypothetical protein [Nakamurella sp. PAMC28650]
MLDLGPEDTVLIAGGEVGVVAVQLARIARKRVIGTGSPSSAGYLQRLGAEPVFYGEGLLDRIHDLGGTVTAALDLHGTDTVDVAHMLAVLDNRICTIAATFPVDDIRSAVELQTGRHVRSKVVVDL